MAIRVENEGVSWWSSGLRVGCCHCPGLGHCCGMGSISGPGMSACCGHAKKERETEREREREREREGGREEGGKEGRKQASHLELEATDVTIGQNGEVRICFRSSHRGSVLNKSY